MTHRSAVALLVVWLSLTCLFTSANINPVPIYHKTADERIVASNSPDAQGSPLTGESFPNRTTATRYTRRFSRPHKLLNVTKPNNVDSAVQGKPDVKRTFVPPNSLWSDDGDDKGAVDDRLSHHEVKVTAPGLVGGAELLRDAAEVEDSNSFADAESRDADMNEYPKKPSVIDANTASLATANPSRTTSTVHNTMLNTHNTTDTNTTLCLDTHTIAIAAPHYAQYIKPYLAWFIQCASDTYESKMEQQNIVNIKRALGSAPVERRASSLLNRVLRKVIETAHALTSTEDESTTTRTGADTVSSSDHDEQEHVHELGEITDKHALEQLQCTIDSLKSVVSGKDASISGLVQRLAALEQELHSVQHTTDTTHSTLTTYTTPATTSNRTSEDSVDTNLSTATSNTSAHSESSIQPTTTSSTLDTNSDTYTTLQGVLKTLHSVSMLMDEVVTQCAITHNTTNLNIAFNTSTDSTGNPNTSDLAIHLIDSTISVPVVYAPVVVRTVYPSIVDEVLVERRKEELYLQSLYDAAAVASLVLNSVHSSCTTSSTSTDGAGGKTTTTSRSTNFGNESAPDQQPDALQAQIEALTARAMVLENELNLASLQLCQLRGQQYQPHTASGSGEETQDTSWFNWF